MKTWLFLLPLALAGCQYPATTVATVDAPPQLQVTGAPAGASLIVDGQPAGPASAFGAGGKALVVPHGTHRVEIRDGATLLYASDVYFGDGATKTISLNSGTP